MATVQTSSIPGMAYVPTNRQEDRWFTNRWCSRCKGDGEFAERGDGCDILELYNDGYRPCEWRIIAGEPECAAFDPIDPLDMPLLSRAVVAELPFKPCLAPVGRPSCAVQRKPAPELSSGTGSSHQTLESPS